MSGTIAKSSASAMTASEVERFERLDGRIERGVRTFVEVGQALAEIRDDRLYRKDFTTFKAYCESKGLSESRVYQMIDAADVSENLHNCGGNIPKLTNEAQARELAKLPAGQQADAFLEAAERTNGKPTAAAIRQVVEERTHTFGDIDADDEPSARDEDEPRTRHGLPKTWNGRTIPDEAPPLNVKQVVDNDPAVRWMRLIADLGHVMAGVPTRETLDSLPARKREHVAGRLNDIARQIMEAVS